ncbi:hypothetical protein [Bifidobacterium crudilactis]|uniref:Uncharacterized protein n=1 Tax=Bifidobacterium crudilactis TaxID=327277 RepID=A0A971CZK5_9BIFI|nr:hypothetical protein [Bifidobacterium crudilactis]MCI1868708.1 hypothetical protein [Bifidobacterium crudilactis]NLT79576.1 hypothetical protein [Bifidobacterium crudilactis]
MSTAPSAVMYEMQHLIGLLVQAVDDGDRPHALHLIRLMFAVMQPVDVIALLAENIGGILAHYEGESWRDNLDLSLLDIEASAQADHPDQTGD